MNELTYYRMTHLFYNLLGFYFPCKNILHDKIKLLKTFETSFVILFSDKVSKNAPKT